jgi:hypothetical protein
VPENMAVTFTLTVDVPTLKKRGDNMIALWFYDYVDGLRYNDQPMEGEPFNMRPAHVGSSSFWTSQGVRYYP